MANHAVAGWVLPTLREAETGECVISDSWIVVSQSCQAFTVGLERPTYLAAPQVISISVLHNPDDLYGRAFE